MGLVWSENQLHVHLNWFRYARLLSPLIFTRACNVTSPSVCPSAAGPWLSNTCTQLHIHDSPRSPRHGFRIVGFSNSQERCETPTPRDYRLLSAVHVLARCGEPQIIRINIITSCGSRLFVSLTSLHPNKNTISLGAHEWTKNFFCVSWKNIRWLTINAVPNDFSLWARAAMRSLFEILKIMFPLKVNYM